MKNNIIIIKQDKGHRVVILDCNQVNSMGMRKYTNFQLPGFNQH